VKTPCLVLLWWTSWWVPCCPVLLLFEVWFSLELSRSVWWIWDFLAWTGLTGELHHCYQCRGLLWKFSDFSSRDWSDRCCSPVWPVLCSGARVACSTAFSSRYRWLFVPRTSRTPVATWSWPTWVVESETCFGSCVRLVGVSISFEKKFYRLPFTSPSQFAKLVLHCMVAKTTRWSRGWFLGWASKSVEPGLCGNRVMSGDWRRLHRVRGFLVVHQKITGFLGLSTKPRLKNKRRRCSSMVPVWPVRSTSLIDVRRHSPETSKRRTHVRIARLATRLRKFAVARHPSDGATTMIPKVPFEGVYHSVRT
jgi:hypothetical protein